MLESNYAKVSDITFQAVPLASQRTCRLLNANYDVKLPIDAQITGERRLLYFLNVRNAPSVSLLAGHILKELPLTELAFQFDVAAIAHLSKGIQPHLSMIIRQQVAKPESGAIHSALNLWSDTVDTKEVLRIANPRTAEEFFYAYANLILAGPILFWLWGGIAFEPHLQNCSIVVSEGRPTSLILRDLDSSILERKLVSSKERMCGAQLERDTWKVMPSSEIGSQRLMHAAGLGHLSTVGARLIRLHGANEANLEQALGQVFLDIAKRAGSDLARRVHALAAQRLVVKKSLSMRLAGSMEMRFQ
jgi:siderophore synthetase component